ncbi:hypothetical protein HN958_00350 [Candidatus Falkowbacteria bacterium]|jgi:MoxR-like ATPase|nr:hypothetical protein [Candidatus Falkowbacteria bacterium]MBT7006939.1 hypothetical protein [Candidatus Falkowbacteria bacterium]
MKEQPSYIDIVDLPGEDQSQLETIEKKFDRFQGLRMKFAKEWKELCKVTKPVIAKREIDGEEREVKLHLTPRKVMNEDLAPEEIREFIDEKAIRDEIAKKKKGLSNAKLDALVEGRIKSKIRKTLELVELRKKLTGEDETETTESEFGKEMIEFTNYRHKEYLKAKKEIAKYSDELDVLVMAKDLASDDDDYETIHEANQAYKEKLEEYKLYLKENPEAFIYIVFDKIKNMKESFDANGRIVETPYVKEVMQDVIEDIAIGQPVFITGELGSGKTELGKHLVRTVLSEKYLERWENGENNMKAHHRPEEPVQSDFNNKAEYKDALAQYVKLFASWKREREAASEPLVISGNKEIDADIFIGGIKIEKMVQMNPEEQVEFINEKVNAYKKANPESSSEMIKDLTDAYVESFKQPVETKAYLGMFYKAMKDGRPIIIDEMNAIPHHILIMLNDLLTKQAGDYVKPMVDDLPEFQVPEGFAVIGTGNWKPDDNEQYVGRQKLDSAFLSRWGLVAYDYLRNEIDVDDFSSKEEATINRTEQEKAELRERREGNELFHMVMTRMIDDLHGTNLPQGAVEQIYNLTRCARVLQDVFSGHNLSSLYGDGSKLYDPSDAVFGSDRKPSDFLHENVLSLRHLIPIVEKWKNEKFKKPLDYYLLKKYVMRSKSRPDELKYIYQILQTVGDFFPKGSDGDWPDSNNPKDYDKLMHGFDRSKSIDSLTERSVNLGEKVTIEQLSTLDFIEAMYGPIPGRQKISKEFMDSLNKGFDKTEEESIEENDELDDIMGDAEKENQLRQIAELQIKIVYNHVISLIDSRLTFEGGLTAFIAKGSPGESEEDLTALHRIAYDCRELEKEIEKNDLEPAQRDDKEAELAAKTDEIIKFVKDHKIKTIGAQY